MLKNQLNIALISLFALLLLTVGAAIFIAPRSEFSYLENRKLADLPTPSLESLASGEFFHSLGDFYSDNLPLRRQFGYIYSILELAIGKQEANRVIALKGDRLIRRYERNAQIYNENLSYLANAKELYGDRIRVFAVANSQTLFEDLVIPSHGGLYADAYDIPPDSLGGRFLHAILEDGKAQKCYYRTDHHWTSFGAYEAYRIICEEYGLECFERSDFEIERLHQSFYGSSFRASALPPSAICADRIELYRYEGDGDYDIRLDGGECRELYDFDALESHDAYLVFLGGNYPHLRISSGTERERLLIVKDSFANSLVPFLARHCDIDLVDPRYASASEIGALLDSGEFDKILVLCSIDTLASERGFCHALGAKP